MKILKAPSGLYVVKVQTAFGRRTIRLNTSSYAEALKLARDRRIRETEMLVKAGVIQAEMMATFISGRKLSVAEAVVEFLEWAMTRKSLKTVTNLNSLLLAWQSSSKLSGITTHEVKEAHVDSFVNKADKVKLSTRAQRANAVKLFCEWCANRALMIGNPAAEIRIRRELLSHGQQETSRTLPFSTAQYETLLNAIQGDIRELELRLAGDGLSDGPRRLLGVKLGQLRFWEVASEASWATGLRLSDVCTLEKGSLAVPGKLIKTTRKTGSRIEIPLRPQLQAKLRAIAAESGSDSVFPVEATLYSDISKRSSLSNWFSRYAKRLGIDRSFHGLRSSNASNANRVGVPLDKIRSNLGHSSSTTTTQYIHQ